MAIKYYDNKRVDPLKDRIADTLEISGTLGFIIAASFTYDTYKSFLDHLDYLFAAFIFYSIAALIFILFVKLTKRLYKRTHLSETTLQKIDTFSGPQFEDYLDFIFYLYGYKTKKIGGSYDFGGDVLIKKNGVSTVIQAKRYSDKVGIKAVQEVIGARTYYKTDKAMVVTNSYFTPSAKRLAKRADVTLMNRDNLSKFIAKAPKKPIKGE